MTKRHFRTIAETLVSTRYLMSKEAYVKVCREFAHALTRENLRFSAAMFLDACGIPREEWDGY